MQEQWLFMPHKSLILIHVCFQSVQLSPLTSNRVKASENILPVSKVIDGKVMHPCISSLSVH